MAVLAHRWLRFRGRAWLLVRTSFLPFANIGVTPVITGLHDVVTSLPDGYATSVEDSFVSGSPGLQQVTMMVPTC
jgi:hypothetical protein